MNYKALLTLVLGVGVAVAAVAQPTPAPDQESILILGGTAHLGTERLENAAIGFRDGKIGYVGFARTVDRARYDRVIEANGGTFTPASCPQLHPRFAGNRCGARHPG